MSAEFKQMIEDLKENKIQFLMIPSTDRLISDRYNIDQLNETEVKELYEAFEKNKSITGFSFFDAMHQGEPKKQIMITLLRALKTKKHFTQLIIPFKVDIELAKEIADVIDAHPELEELEFKPDTIQDPQCIDLIFQSISHHPHLQKLKMAQLPIGGDKPIHQSILQRLGQILKTATPPLKELRLPFTNLIGRDIKIFVDAWVEGLSTKNTLVLLDLGGNHIWNDGGESLAKMLSLNSVLHTLSLYQGHIEGDGFTKILNALKVNKSVINLDLSHNVIHISEGEIIASIIEQNKTLTSLSLADCDMREAIIHIPSGERTDSQDYVVKIFEALSKNKTLTSLRLEKCSGIHLGDKATMALAEALKVNSSLQKLTLNSNPIGDKGAKTIALGLKENKGLHELILTKCEIGDTGCSTLKEAANGKSTLRVTTSWDLKGSLDKLMARFHAIKNQQTDSITGQKPLNGEAFMTPQLQHDQQSPQHAPQSEQAQHKTEGKIALKQ